MKRNPATPGQQPLKEAKWQAFSAPGAIMQQDNSSLPLQSTNFHKIAAFRQVRVTNRYNSNHI
jgi:hypothetical protein